MLPATSGAVGQRYQLPPQRYYLSSSGDPVANCKGGNFPLVWSKDYFIAILNFLIHHAAADRYSVIYARITA